MLFNSDSFLLFYSIVFLLLLLLQSLRIVSNAQKIRIRNCILLLASYYFYACLHWKFILILLFTTGVNYYIPLKIASAYTQEKPKLARNWVVVALVFSIGILAYFKYVNFFIDSVNTAMAQLGIGMQMELIKVLLPVGISFFTFQALTYTLDVYRQKISVRKSLIDIALFISFFPTILSGPIEKARNLLPQLESRQKLTMANLVEGGKLFVWGLFKKAVIADRLANYIDVVYASDVTAHSSITLTITAILYSFQIYADFSGYSDMAIGIARSLGFRLSENFRFPYFASSIKEFWKRWHISLTSWFSEYMYISMGGNRVSRARWVLNISTIFLVSGLWHGANWAFIVWGALHAIYYLIEHYYKKSPLYSGLHFVSHGIVRTTLSTLIVFALVTLAWIFFRTEDSIKTIDILRTLFSKSGGFYWGMSAFTTALTLTLLCFFVMLDWVKYKQLVKNKWMNAVGYAILLCLVLLLGVSESNFVYFQF